MLYLCCSIQIILWIVIGNDHNTERKAFTTQASKHLVLCDRPMTMTRADQTACQQFAATNKHGCMYRWWPLLGQSLRPIDKWGGWVINHTNWKLIKRIWLWRVIFQNGTDLTIWRIAEELSFRVFHCAWNRAIHQAGHPQFRDAQLPF